LGLAILIGPGYSSGQMAKLVFDIETTALPLEGFDAAQLEYLFRDAENLPDPAQRPVRRAEIQRFFSLWPLTGRIVCMAMANVDSFRSKVLFLAGEDKEKGKDERELPASVEFVPCANEAELLTEFWEVAVHYESIITFNGRSFDVPFIYLRSALLDVGISRKDWLGYRFQIEPHCDLLEQLTFYNVSGREGAARRFNLDFYCKAFGIPSPKSEGITGMDVGRLMAEGRAREVAAYCLGDVQATAKLYKIWKERLAGIT
jgi:DNA polymerase elongation subunit (family B)